MEWHAKLSLHVDLDLPQPEALIVSDDGLRTKRKPLISGDFNASKPRLLAWRAFFETMLSQGVGENAVQTVASTRQLSEIECQTPSSVCVVETLLLQGNPTGFRT